MIDQLNFFKGIDKNLPKKDKLKKHSFYLSEDTYDFYYSDNNLNLSRFGADPSSTIKEIHTYYSLGRISNPNELNYPPDFLMTGLTENKPKYEKGEQIYSIKCIVYMDDHYVYTQPDELITQYEIDAICSTEISTTSRLGVGVVGYMVLNMKG